MTGLLLPTAPQWPAYSEVEAALFPFRDAALVAGLVVLSVLLVVGVALAIRFGSFYIVLGLLCGLFFGGAVSATLYRGGGDVEEERSVAESLAGPLAEAKPGWAVVDPAQRRSVWLGTTPVTGATVRTGGGLDGTVRFLAAAPDGGLHECTITYPASVSVVRPDGTTGDVATVPETTLRCSPETED